MENIKAIFSLVFVGALWGATNPFIRKGSQGIERIETGSKWKNLIQEIRSIGSRIQYWIPFLLNQSGSVLFVWTLQDSPLTAVVPIANSLSFAFTAIAGYFLGEKIPGKNVIFGTILVSLGGSLLLYDKMLGERETSIDIKFDPNSSPDLLNS